MIRLNKLYLMFFTLFVVVSLIYGGMLFYYMFYSMLFLLLLALFYVLLLSKLLTVELKLDSDVSTVGEINNCRIIVKVSNEIPIPYITVKISAAEMKNSQYEGMFKDIAVDESLWMDCPLKFDKRGVYDPAEVELTYFDLFKIIGVKKVYNSNHLIKVYPKIFNIKKSIKLSMNFYGQNINSNGMKDDIYFIKDIKPYREGDSLNKVHWKLSAKAGKLYIKNFDKISGEEAKVLVNFHKDNYSYDVEEQVCELFLSIINYLTNNGIDSEVYFNDYNSENYTIRSKMEFYSFMEYIINKKSDGNKAFSKFLEEQALSLSKGSELIIVTGFIDKSISNTLEHYIKIGYKPTVFYCLENSMFKDNIRCLKNLGISAVNISAVSGKEIKWSR